MHCSKENLVISSQSPLQIKLNVKSQKECLNKRHRKLWLPSDRFKHISIVI